MSKKQNKSKKSKSQFIPHTTRSYFMVKRAYASTKSRRLLLSEPRFVVLHVSAGAPMAIADGKARVGYARTVAIFNKSGELCTNAWTLNRGANTTAYNYSRLYTYNRNAVQSSVQYFKPSDESCASGLHGCIVGLRGAGDIKRWVVSRLKKQGKVSPKDYAKGLKAALALANGLNALVPSYQAKLAKLLPAGSLL